jgi:hypothetical protein
VLDVAAPFEPEPGTNVGVSAFIMSCWPFARSFLKTK